MNTLWDDVRKSLKEFSTVAIEKAEEFGKIASDKAEELTIVGKIKIELLQLKRTYAKKLGDLGAYTYQKELDGEYDGANKDESFIAIFEEIKKIEAEIHEKEELVKHQEDEGVIVDAMEETEASEDDSEDDSKE